MGSEGDISLPAPPPPNPAARRAAIDAAMRKFDGVEEAPATPKRRRLDWAAMHRRPAGGLVAAALVAVIAIPATYVGLRDQPAGIASEEAAPGPASPASDAAPTAQPPEVLREPSQPAPNPVTPAAETRPPASAPVIAEGRSGPAPAENAQKVARSAPAPMMAAPAPPPFAAALPPPSPAQEMADTAGADNIVVTGSRVPRPNLESASPITVIGVTSNDFLSTLRAALDADDRRAVIRLIAIPLRVNFSDGRRTYRSSRDIERDFDRIFTPAVREAISDLSGYDLATRDGGRLRGGDRIWFGCGKMVCRDEAAIRVREITP